MGEEDTQTAGLYPQSFWFSRSELSPRICILIPSWCWFGDENKNYCFMPLKNSETNLETGVLCDTANFSYSNTKNKRGLKCYTFSGWNHPTNLLQAQKHSWKKPWEIQVCIILTFQYAHLEESWVFEIRGLKAQNETRNN